MSTQQLLEQGWSWDPFTGVVCVGLGLSIGVVFARRRTLRVGWQILALGVIVAALVSPIALLANGYLFSAHMLQHLLLLLVAPALWLLGLRRLNSEAPGRERRPRLPWLSLMGWLAGVGAMWIWHAPSLCNAATLSPAVHRLQVISLLAMGSAFWWPIAGPRAPSRLSPLAGIAYLASACLACTLLGIFITFTPVSVCPVYLHPADKLGLLPLLHQGWGLTPAIDQQVGGLLMWLPACLVYLTGVIGLLARWFGELEPEEKVGDSTWSAEPSADLSRESESPTTLLIPPDERKRRSADCAPQSKALARDAGASKLLPRI